MARAIFQAYYPIIILAWALLQDLRRRQDFPPDTGFWDSFLANQADPYLIFYAVLPVWLIAVGFLLPSSTNEISLVRAGSRARQLSNWTRRMFRQAGIVALTLTLAAFVTSIGLELRSTWNPDSAESSFELVATGISPGLAVVGQLLLLTVSLTLLAMTAYIARLCWTSPISTVITLTGIYVLLLLGGMGPSPIALSRGFVIFGHDSTGSAVTTISILIVISVALWAAVHLRERRGLSISTRTGRILLLAFVLLLVMFTHALPLSQGPFNLADLLNRAFIGGDVERVNPLGFAGYALIFGVGALLIGTAATQRDQGVLPLLAVRYGRISRWGGIVLGNIALLSGALIVGVIAAAALVTLLLGGTLLSPDLSPALLTVGVIGVLQTCFLATISAATVVADLGSRGTLSVYAVTQLLAMPLINQNRSLPFGLSMIADPTGGTFSHDLMIMAASTLVITMAGLIFPRFTQIQRLILGRSN